MTSDHTPRPAVSTIEKAYIRGLKEGMRRGEARRAYLSARVSELVIRLKTAKGELIRIKNGHA